MVVDNSEAKVTVTEPISPMDDINKAYAECKFGRFHIRLLITTFAGCIASILVTNSSSYILPIAECDLDMNLKQKGLLTAMPFIGMYISSLAAGFLNDIFGRILFLKIGYGGLFLFSVVSALSQNYLTFSVGKFGEGFAFAIAMNALYSMTSEFCHHSVRDRVLLCQSSFSAMAQIICPAMAWGFLIQNWEWHPFNGLFVLKQWNFFLLALSFWAFGGFVLYCTLPESPKFLVTQKRYLEARNIIIKVYTENTGKSADTFPYLDLWDNEIKEEAKKNDVQKDVYKEMKIQIWEALRAMKPILQRPLIIYLSIVGLMQLIIIATYCVLKMWFPQLSTIVEYYPLEEYHNLCGSLDRYTVDERIKFNANVTVSNATVVCVPTVSGTETYVNSIIMGVVCMVPYFISGALVNRLGKKCLLILTGAFSLGALIGIRWSSSNFMMVAMFSIDVAMTQMMKSLILMVLVEVFPVSMRSVAMSIVTSLSTFGILISNVGFPILLEFGCELPFYLLDGGLAILIILAIFTPRKQEN